MLQFPTFTTAIYDQYRSTFNGAAANMIAGVLVLCCVLLLTAELRLRGHRRYAWVSHGAARPVERRLGAALLPTTPRCWPAWSRSRWASDVPASCTGLPSGPRPSSCSATCSRRPAPRWAWVPRRRRSPCCWRCRSPGCRALPHRREHRGRAEHRMSPTRCPASSSPSRWSPCRSGSCSRSTRPTSCLLIAYAIMFLPRAVVSVRAASSRRRSCWTTWRTAWAAGRSDRLPRHPADHRLRPRRRRRWSSWRSPPSRPPPSCWRRSTLATLATEFWSASSVAYGAAAPYALLMVLDSIPATILLGRQATVDSPFREDVR